MWENKELTLDLVVRPDGKISMPLIQDVVAEGQTAVELSNTIRERLLTFIKEPQVSVIVLQVNAPKYFVIGNVAKPGTYLPSQRDVDPAGAALAGGLHPVRLPPKHQADPEHGRETGGAEGELQQDDRR